MLGSQHPLLGVEDLAVFGLGVGGPAEEPGGSRPVGAQCEHLRLVGVQAMWEGDPCLGCLQCRQVGPTPQHRHRYPRGGLRQVRRSSGGQRDMAVIKRPQVRNQRKPRTRLRRIIHPEPTRGSGQQAHRYLCGGGQRVSGLVPGDLGNQRMHLDRCPATGPQLAGKVDQANRQQPFQAFLRGSGALAHAC